MRNFPRTLPRNYSIRNIIDSILSDTGKAHRLPQAKKIRLYSSVNKKVDSLPELRKVLTASHLRGYPIEGAGFFARVGIVPPELVIVDERFKRMCCLPYWTIYKSRDGAAYKRFDRCPGYDRLPGCPPQSPDIPRVVAKLDSADAVIVLQTKLLGERWGVDWKFAVLHALARDIEHVLGKGAVVERYGSGPCSACHAQLCLHGQSCKTPELKTVALESMGICVDRLCSDLAQLTGDSRWKLKWLRHFGLPQQTPKKWKYVEALAVKLPV